MWASLAEAVAQFCLTFLEYFMARKDLEDKTKLEVADAINKLALVAAQWKSAAVATPDGGGDLHVVSGGGTVPLPRADADPPGSAR